MTRKFKSQRADPRIIYPAGASKVGIRVSDHAVLRFLERAYGVAVEEARAELVTPAVVAAMRQFKSGLVPTANAAGLPFSVRFEGRAVLTVVCGESVDGVNPMKQARAGHRQRLKDARA